jgi:hypothetical protein
VTCVGAAWHSALGARLWPMIIESGAALRRTMSGVRLHRCCFELPRAHVAKKRFYSFLGTNAHLRALVRCGSRPPVLVRGCAAGGVDPRCALHAAHLSTLVCSSSRVAHLPTCTLARAGGRVPGGVGLALAGTRVFVWFSDFAGLPRCGRGLLVSTVALCGVPVPHAPPRGPRACLGIPTLSAQSFPFRIYVSQSAKRIPQPSSIESTHTSIHDNLHTQRHPPPARMQMHAPCTSAPRGAYGSRPVRRISSTMRRRK